jgi:hypothetical protein
MDHQNMKTVNCSRRHQQVLIIRLRGSYVTLMGPIRSPKIWHFLAFHNDIGVKKEGHYLPYLWRLHRTYTRVVQGVFKAFISQSQIWAVGVPPGGFQKFQLISGVYISLEMDHQKMKSVNYIRWHQQVLIIRLRGTYDPLKGPIRSLQIWHF